MNHNSSRKYKELFSDSAAFFVSNFASKILSFLLIPLYTSVLNTEDYGTADLLISTVNVLYPLLTLCIMEATLRFAFEKMVNKDNVLTNSLMIISLSVVVFIFLTPVIKYFNVTVYEYWGWFIVIYAGYNLHQVLSQYAKGIGKTKIFAISGVVHTMVVISSNIIGLLILKQGLNAYFGSMVAGYFLTSMYIVVFAQIRIERFAIDWPLLKDMLKFCAPTVPSVISWWISTSADKYMIAAYLGVAVSGLYGIAYKIPSMLTMVTNIFISAWTISAIKNVEDKDAAEYQATVYKYFRIINVLACTVLIMFSQMLGKILFANEFYIAWKCVPLLLVAYLYSGLSGFMASSFRAIKKTKELMISTMIGAMLNIFLNVFVIKKFGIMGAAATTAIGFAVTFYIRSVSIKRIVDLKVPIIKDSLVYALLAIQAILVGGEVEFSYLISSLLTIVILFIYRREIRYICITVARIIRRAMLRRSVKS